MYRSRRRQRGQIVPITALAMIALIGGVALILEGGNAYAHQREAQNGSDAVANAGATVLAQFIGGTSKTDADVSASMNNVSNLNYLNDYDGYYTNVTGQWLTPRGATTASQGAAGVLAGNVPINSGLRSSDDVFTFSVAPKIKFGDRASLYARVAKGYRPGGAGIPVHLNTQECTDQLNQLGGGANYEADTLWSYELGLKTQLFDRHLSIEGSVYHIDWSNIISAVHVPLCATHISKNLGDAKSDGFDLSVKALLSEGFSAGLSVGYTNARYSSDSEIFGETLARSGQAISDIAPWNVTAELMYQRLLTDKVTGYGRIEDRYTSRNNRLVPAEDSTTVTYDPFITTNPAVNQLNGRLGVRFGDGSDLALVATNLLNTHPVLNEQIFLINITSGAFTVRPRTYGLAYSYHW